MIIKVRTQAELDAALLKATGADRVTCVGAGRFEARESAHVEAWGSAHVEAWESARVVARGSAHVEARESARVVAWGSAHVEARGSAHVEAWGSAHVEAWESARVEARESAHVVAGGSAHVVAWGSAHVEAGHYVSVHLYGSTVDVIGGVQIQIPDIRTPEQWCDWYGAAVSDGTVTLYKAVDDHYVSSHDFAYTPGTEPAAPDWDGGEAECGGGLHFCAHPLLARAFHPAAKRFVACPVRVNEIKVHFPAAYPSKVKAPRVCGPVWECDRHGERITDAETAARSAPGLLHALRRDRVARIRIGAAVKDRSAWRPRPPDAAGAAGGAEMIRRITDGIVLDDLGEPDTVKEITGRWYFSAGRIARALTSQGVSPDGAASIVGQMIEDGLQALREAEHGI